MPDITTRNRKAQRHIDKCRHREEARMERLLAAAAAGSVLLSLATARGWLL